MLAEETCDCSIILTSQLIWADAINSVWNKSSPDGNVHRLIDLYVWMCGQFFLPITLYVQFLKQVHSNKRVFMYVYSFIWKFCNIDKSIYDVCMSPPMRSLKNLGWLNRRVCFFTPLIFNNLIFVEENFLQFNEVERTEVCL